MPRARIEVTFADKPGYAVRVGSGLLESVGPDIAETTGAHRIVLISDSNVEPLYAGAVHQSCAQAGLRVVDITVPAGEESKSIECATEIWNALAQSGITRDCAIVALGGGVVGDLSGFIAATFMRGLPFVQIPTSLLAMVDSSVGGKTAINLDAGKNLVGAFLQPAHVSADTSTLATLDQREWACGCAEIAKCSVLESDAFFFWLSEHADKLVDRDAEVVQEAITRSVVFKADVVAADETETAGVRECLNYGHTLAHAIETLAGFGVYSHGAAVAEGMRFAARLAAQVNGLSLDVVSAQDDLLDALGIPPLPFSAPSEKIIACMKSDKKTRDGQIRFVLPTDIGSWEACSVDTDVLTQHLDAWAASKEG